MTEYTAITEADAKARRRAFINAGCTVSLIGYDGSRDLYAFDVQVPLVATTPTTGRKS